MVRIKSFGSYITKNSELAFGAICATGMTCFGLNFLPHSLGLQKYKNILQAYKNGIEREITPKNQFIFEKSLELANVNEFEKRIIQPFSVYGFDALSIGSTKFRNGALVGIPINYTYETVNDIDKLEILIRNQKIDWDTETGKLLQEALVLTEDEKVFGITRAILETKSNKILLYSMYPCVSILFIYTVANMLNRKMNLFARPFGIRGILYFLLGFFGYGLWSFMQDFTCVQYDTKVDKEMCELGPEMIEAGARFYLKLLQKNIAIRELTGDNTYTVKGNLNYILRQKTLPLTVRRMFFESKLHEKEKL